MTHASGALWELKEKANLHTLFSVITRRSLCRQVRQMEVWWRQSTRCGHRLLHPKTETTNMSSETEPSSIPRVPAVAAMRASLSWAEPQSLTPRESSASTSSPLPQQGPQALANLQVIHPTYQYTSCLQQSHWALFQEVDLGQTWSMLNLERGKCWVFRPLSETVNSNNSWYERFKVYSSDLSKIMHSFGKCPWKCH